MYDLTKIMFLKIIGSIFTVACGFFNISSLMLPRLTNR
uniref:Uncharacterized protein n=1 Tax=Tetranychus urticae TaxID=32264 RepID=T1JQY9_TETUR